MTENAIADINEDNIEWQEFTSEQGNKYQVGYLKTDEPATNAELAKNGFSIPVDWPVSDSKKPIQTTPQVEVTAGISEYYLNTQNGIWSYRLNFRNTAIHEYIFTDASGDQYKVSAILKRWHYLRYNSYAPTIINVAG